MRNDYNYTETAYSREMEGQNTVTEDTPDMDPQQMWQDIVDMAHTVDVEDADPLASLDPDALVTMVEQIKDLNTWLVRGGFPPKGVTPTKDIEQEVISAETKNEYPRRRG